MLFAIPRNHQANVALHYRPMAEAADDHPVVRDYDSHMFCVTRNKQFMVGGFEPHAKPAFGDGIPQEWKNTLRGDEEQFSKLKCF